MNDAGFVFFPEKPSGLREPFSHDVIGQNGLNLRSGLPVGLVPVVSSP